MMLLERMETPKYYPGSTVTDPPSKLEQLVSDSNKQQTPQFVSKLGPLSQRDSHKSHLQPKSHKFGTAQDRFWATPSQPTAPPITPALGYIAVR